MNRMEWSPSATESQEEEQCHRGGHETITCRTGGKRRLRTNFTEHQSAELERSFMHSHYPDQPTKREMALRLEIPEDRITVWFQNRRAKWRRKENREKSAGKPPNSYAGNSQTNLVTNPEIYAAREPAENFCSRQLNANRMDEEGPPIKLGRYNSNSDASSDATGCAINGRFEFKNSRSESEVFGAKEYAKVVFGDLFNNMTSEGDDDPSNCSSSIEDLIKEIKYPFCPTNTTIHSSYYNYTL